MAATPASRGAAPHRGGRRLAAAFVLATASFFCISVSAAAQRSMADKLDDLVSWAAGYGANLGNIQLSFDGTTNRTHMHLKQAVKASEPVLTVPVGIGMSWNTMSNAPRLEKLVRGLYALAGVVEEPGAPTDVHPSPTFLELLRNDAAREIALSLFLHHEAFYNPVSPYTAYLRTLPTSTLRTPLFFRSADAALLEALPDVHSRIADMRSIAGNWVQIVIDNVMSNYPDVYGSVHAADIMRKWQAELRWTFMIVKTRALPASAVTPYMTIIPILDSIVTKTGGAPLSGFVATVDQASPTPSIRAVGMTAAQLMPAGTEVFAWLPHHATCSIEYAATFGYINEGATQHCLKVPLIIPAISSADVMGVLRRSLFNALGMNVSLTEKMTSEYFVRSNEPIDPHLLRALRIISLSAREVPYLTNSSFAGVVTMDNEVEVVRSLQGIAQGLIKRSRESWSEAVMKGLVPEHESEYTHNQRLLATMHNSTVRAAEWIEKWSVQHWSSFLDE